MSVKIKKVTKEKVKLKELENGQTFEIDLKNISRIDRNITPIKARYNTTIIGAILAGGYIASVGNWDGSTNFFAGMIITPLVATLGGGIGFILGTLADISNKSNKQYHINDDEWNYRLKKKVHHHSIKLFSHFGLKRNKEIPIIEWQTLNQN